MPRVEQVAHDTEAEYVEAVLAVWAEFELPPEWRRSMLGDLCRHWDGKTQTISAVQYESKQ